MNTPASSLSAVANRLGCHFFFLVPSLLFPFPACHAALLLLVSAVAVSLD
jgi:hypothetical protein